MFTFPLLLLNKFGFECNCREGEVLVSVAMTDEYQI